MTHDRILLNIDVDLMRECAELNRQPFIPHDANPTAPDLARIDPYDKFRRGKGFRSTERGDFYGICEFGLEQLIVCLGGYMHINDRITSYEAAAWCRKCPHCVAGKKGGPLYDPLCPAKSVWRANDVASHFAPDTDVVRAEAYVYFISDGEYVKIGVATDPASRLAQLQTANARQLEILFLIPAESKANAIENERRLHHVLSDYRLEGEWFNILDKLDIAAFREEFAPEKYLKEE